MRLNEVPRCGRETGIYKMKTAKFESERTKSTRSNMRARGDGGA